MATTLDTSIAKTSLAAVKRQGNITSVEYDDKLTELINTVSQKITTLLNGREIVATDYVQWLDGNGEGEFVVPQYPLIRVNLLATGRCRSMTVQYTGSDTRATAQITATGLGLTSWGTGGVTATDVDWASYETVAEVVTQVTDNVTGWTATLIEDTPSKWLRPRGGRDAKTSAIDIEAPDCFDVEYDIKRDAGIIQFTGWRHALAYEPAMMRPAHGMGLGGAYLADPAPFGGLAILADYRAGFETIPADIEQVAREAVVQAFDSSYRDGSIKSESLGGYSYTLADQALDSGKYSAVLIKYTREVLA
ncbi:MAG: hypothetical protein AAGI37_15480 [Planctomycetota bacterium]